MKLRTSLALLACLALAACGVTPEGRQDSLFGAAAGAVTGALADPGHVGGALIGAGAGAFIGGAVGDQRGYQPQYDGGGYAPPPPVYAPPPPPVYYDPCHDVNVGVYDYDNNYLGYRREKVCD